MSEAIFLLSLAEIFCLQKYRAEEKRPKALYPCLAKSVAEQTLS